MNPKPPPAGGQSEEGRPKTLFEQIQDALDQPAGSRERVRALLAVLEKVLARLPGVPPSRGMPGAEAIAELESILKQEGSEPEARDLLAYMEVLLEDLVQTAKDSLLAVEGGPSTNGYHGPIDLGISPKNGAPGDFLPGTGDGPWPSAEKN